MKKNDLIILIVLFALWVMWPNIYRHFNPSSEIPATESGTPSEPASIGSAQPQTPGVSAVEGEPAVSRPQEPALPGVAPAALPAASPASAPEDTSAAEAATYVLENDVLRLTFTGLGGTLLDATLKDYPELNEADSPPVFLDFREKRSAAYQGLSGFDDTVVFEGKLNRSAKRVVFTRTVNGLTLQRTYSLSGSYQLELEDTFVNRSGQALQMPDMAMQTGAFYDPPGATKVQGLQSLGVDTLAMASDKVKHHAGKMYKNIRSDQWQEYLPAKSSSVDWVASKNKYFVQILSPEDGGQYATTFGKWDVEEKRLRGVGAWIHFPDYILQEGGSFTRNTVIYTGPKKLDILKSLHGHKDGIMQLGWWFLPWVGEKLLWMINGLQGMWPYSYGLAIMLVTLVMRIFFWPLTHKGTESMRRMSELSPQMKVISEKYKENPQKRQEVMMKFYKENKINPVGGCLPMLVQIPIFLSLFYVLRSAIELRFAEFLWIEDLSEADRLFAFGFDLPIFGEYFNILPILMAISMYLQQKVAPMTPNSSMDETQAQIQKTMMRMMPVMMLFVLYNFSAGLALYWTTQNVLMIVQHLVYKKRKEIKAAHAAA
jgi:YidC/Oxa1 family membrane protein insertase